MFNVTVLKMKDIVKYVLSLIFISMLFIFTSKIFSNINKTKENNLQSISVGSFVSCLEKTLPTISVTEEENKIADANNISQKKYLEEFLKTEISSMKGMEEQEKKTIINEDKQEEVIEENNMVLANAENTKTEIVTPNPITESFNVQYGKVKIKNQTTYTLTEDMLKPDIEIQNKNVLIFHTHSCESYTPSEKYPYTQTGNFRTTDLNYTVTRVGTELENYLKKYNINANHNTSYHDHPAYNGSYTRSLETVENILKTTTSDIIIDIHRDAIGSREDYAPTVKIGDDYCAQIMFVIRNKCRRPVAS